MLWPCGVINGPHCKNDEWIEWNMDCGPDSSVSFVSIHYTTMYATTFRCEEDISVSRQISVCGCHSNVLFCICCFSSSSFWESLWNGPLFPFTPKSAKQIPLHNMRMYTAQERSAKCERKASCKNCTQFSSRLAKSCASARIKIT